MALSLTPKISPTLVIGCCFIRFVNSSFRKQNNNILENCEKGKKTIVRKELNKDLYEIKEDLLNSTLNSNIKYHNWINLHKVNGAGTPVLKI